MKVGSLFSGIGGFDLGLEEAGMQVVWQSEIEPYCCKALKKHWPNVPNLGDIYGIKDPPSVDLICGGFPCQPFSVAGKRKGKADDRYLWPQTIRVIGHVKPRWIVLENVLGLAYMVEQIGKTKVESKTLQRLSQSDFYKGVFTRQELLLLAVIIEDIEKAGYSLPQLKDKTPVIPVIPACALNAPHRRSRVWIVANAKDSDGWPVSDQDKQGRRTPEAGGSDRHASHSIRTRAGSQSGETSNEGGGTCKGGRTGIRQGDGETSPGGVTSTNRHAPDTESQRRNGTRQDVGMRPGFTTQCNHGTGETTERKDSFVWEWKENWPEVATNLLRVDDGLPAWVHRHRVARLKALGNAIVPQIAEEIGRMIMQIEHMEKGVNR